MKRVGGRSVCDTCSKPYYRRHRIEMWTSQNPGHRSGWQKILLNICTRCRNERAAQRIIVLTERGR